MAQLVAQRYPASQLALYLSQQNTDLSTSHILALAEAGDLAALVVFNELVDILSIVICNTATLLDPEIIIIGGPTDWNWNRLVDAIRNRINSALLRPVNLQCSRLGNNALILGGAYTSLRMLCTHPNPEQESTLGEKR